MASNTRPQANLILLKVQDDFMKLHGWGSENLKREISYCGIGPHKARIEFTNGSYITVVTASESGRGERANVLVILRLSSHIEIYGCNWAKSMKAKWLLVITNKVIC